MTLRNSLVKFKYPLFLIMAILPCLFSIPTAAKANEFSLRLNMVEDLILRGDYERAIDNLLLIEFGSDKEELRIAASLLSSRLYELSGKTETAIRLLERISDREGSGLSSPLHMKLRKEQIRLMLIMENVSPAQALANNENIEIKTPISKPNLYKAPFYKNKVFSASASVLIPGSGQVLQGRPQDALTSWIMIGIPLALSINARRAGEDVFATSMGILAGFFYFGNIASAYRIAEKDEEQIQDRRWKIQINEIFPSSFEDSVKQIGLSIQVSKSLSNR